MSDEFFNAILNAPPHVCDYCDHFSGNIGQRKKYNDVWLGECLCVPSEWYGKPICHERTHTCPEFANEVR